MKIIISIIIIASLAGCNQAGTNAPEKNKQTMVQQMDSTVNNNLSKLHFASKKDLSCGMPVSAGVADTVTYKGKLYGFCSAECKKDFLKDPEGHLAAK